MKGFSFSPQVPLRAPAADRRFVAKLAQLASEPDLRDIVSTLGGIYKKADAVGNHRIACRKCAGCCRHRLVQAYAVEVTYLMSVADDAHANLLSASGEPCPALSEDNSCAGYARRPLACRVFQPWSRWTALRGCANYPGDRDSAGQLGGLLAEIENLNQAFVHRFELHRDLDFDYLRHWSMPEWFMS